MINKYYWWLSAWTIMEKGPIVEDWHFNPCCCHNGKGTWECVTLDWYVDEQGNRIGEPVRIRHNHTKKSLTVEDEYATAKEGYEAIKACEKEMKERRSL